MWGKINFHDNFLYSENFYAFCLINSSIKIKSFSQNHFLFPQFFSQLFMCHTNRISNGLSSVLLLIYSYCVRNSILAAVSHKKGISINIPVFIPLA